MEGARMKKNPWVAAVLNFLLFGGGTLYVGQRVLVGVLLTLGGTTAQVVEIMVSPLVGNSIPSLWPFLLGGLVLAKVGLAVDAYGEARSTHALGRAA
jgi:hypothetical protein